MKYDVNSPKYRKDVAKRKFFEDICCMKCAREGDAAGDGFVCPIHQKMLAFMRNDPGFPKQIRFVDDGYQCSEFRLKR